MEVTSFAAGSMAFTAKGFALRESRVTATFPVTFSTGWTKKPSSLSSAKTRLASWYLPLGSRWTTVPFALYGSSTNSPRPSTGLIVVMYVAGFAPSASMCRTVTSYDSTSRSATRPVRTCWPSPDASTVPPKTPSTVPLRVSTVTVVAAVPPAGTVSWASLTVNMPAGAGPPDESTPETLSRRVTAWAPWLR